jgi:catalase
MKQPNKDWKEVILPNEEEIFKKYSDRFIQLQRKKNAEHGRGRGLHRKQILALTASLEIKKDIPDYAKVGLFAKPNTYTTQIRLSNGGMDRKADTVPDIRGFAIKVLGVNGEGALGGKTNSQDFLLINHSTFSLPDFESFIKLVLALGNGIGSLFSYLISTYGFIGAIKKMGDTVKTMGKPFSGFATESFHSAAPISAGDYAIKVKLQPTKTEASKKKDSWAIDFRDHLKNGDITYDLQIQFFVDDATTPIENPTIEWPESQSPFITVGRLTVSMQDVDLENSSEFAKEINLAKFDPWNALIEHKPLGQIMRARKHYYFLSQKERE